MITTINEFKNIFESLEHSDYLKWKRNNVTYRGISSDLLDEPNGGSAILGAGLYTAALSNKSMAKGYGELYFVVNAIPKKPLKFNGLNDWQIYLYNNLVFNYCQKIGKKTDKIYFNQNTTIEDEVQKMGYDGIIIKGREMVNYKPEKIYYFKNEIALKDYYFNILNSQYNETVFNEKYKEENNSVVIHNNIKYSINDLLTLSYLIKPKKIKISDLDWVLDDKLNKKRVKKSNYKIPIIITKWYNKYVVLDGVHRLQKAIDDNKQDILCKIVNNTDLQKCKIDK